MKDKIMGILTEKDRVSYSLTDIARAIDENYQADLLNELEKELGELIIEGKVYLTKKNKYTFINNTPYKIGKLELNESSRFGFVILDGEDLYINKSNLNRADDNDIVLCEVITSNKGKSEGKVIKVLRKQMDDIIGEILFVNNKPTIILDNKKLNYEVELISYPDNLVDGLKVSIKLLKEIKKNVYTASVITVIGHKNAPGTDIKMIEHEKGIPTEWTEGILKEVEQIPGKLTDEIINKELKVRKDLREEEIFTIDGADTKDVDDALSLKILDNGNYKLGVHIADVSYYVLEGSEIRKEAFRRGNSYYLADRVTPMLPPELSNGICSLNPNVDRLAISCEMEIDNNSGKILNYNVFKSIINSKKKMTYSSVNKVFENKTEEDYKEFEETLNNMKELSSIIRKERVQRGYIDFERDEVKLIVDENGLVSEVKKRERGIGEKLIEDFMIAANESVASYIYNMDLPFVYRIHSTPSPEKLKEFTKFLGILGFNVPSNINYEKITNKDIQNLLLSVEHDEKYPVVADNLLRSMAKAIYSNENIGHFGLASKIYTHFTSPIRRYSDLTVHTLLDEYVFSNNLNQSLVREYENTLPFICEHISETERVADEAEREVDKMKIAEYMEKHIGDEYNAIINGVMDKGFFVETDNLIGGFVSVNSLKGYFSYNEDLMSLINKHGEKYTLGDVVKVVCVRASKEQRQVDFEIVKGDKNGNIK